MGQLYNCIHLQVHTYVVTFWYTACDLLCTDPRVLHETRVKFLYSVSTGSGRSCCKASCECLTTLWENNTTTTGPMPLSPKTIATANLKASRLTSLQQLLLYCNHLIIVIMWRDFAVQEKWDETKVFHYQQHIIRKNG